ncbi:MAG TPA: carboxypeptidase regulatory-like domain-containing protein [Longimicrobiales bacterium]|nr:carboxypeptidase regulatory-like domain-containing protein [Longimicrobiales bacterium]
MNPSTNRRSNPGGWTALVRRRRFLAIVLAAACETEDCTEPQDLFDIDGTVTVNNQPAAGITVEAGGKSTTTSADGHYRLTFANTSVPSVTVVPPAGVHFKQTSVPIAAIDNTTVNFEGYREADISGRVLAFGQPVSGVQLELHAFGADQTTTSAMDGSYRFEEVPPSLLVPHYIEARSGPAGFELGLGGTGIPVSILGFDITLDLVGSFRGGAHVRGRVTSGGVGLGGVIVTGAGAYPTADTTASGGNYTLGPVLAGSYTVSISNFDTAAHRFAVTSHAITLRADTVIDFAAMPIVPNEPPTAAIQQPATGATFQQGTPIAFAGSGTDPEDGALTGAALAWSSTINGALGTGATRTVTSLSPGAHTITLTATDAQGLTGTASIALTITPAPAQPGSIQGAVTANGNPIGGVAVTLSGDASASTTTSGTGTYSFNNLQPGSYTVTITNPFPGVSFPSLSQTVTVASGQTRTVNFSGTYNSSPGQ